MFRSIQSRIVLNTFLRNTSRQVIFKRAPEVKETRLWPSLFVCGSIPMWAVGFKVNGDILANATETGNYFQTFGSSLIISCVSVVVVIYQLFALAVGSSLLLKKPIRENLKLNQIMTLESDTSAPTGITKYFVTYTNGVALTLTPDQVQLLSSKSSSSLNVQVKETPTSFGSEVLTFEIYPANIKQPKQWRKFIKACDFKTSPPSVGWQHLGSAEKLKLETYKGSKHFNMGKFTGPGSMDYLVIQYEGKGFTIPFSFICESNKSLWKIVNHNGLAIECGKCQTQLSLENNSFKTIIKHNTEIWADFSEQISPPFSAEFKKDSVVDGCPNQKQSKRKQIMG